MFCQHWSVGTYLWYDCGYFWLGAGMASAWYWPGVGTSFVLVLARFWCGLVFVLNRVWHDVGMALASCWLDFLAGMMVAWWWHCSNWWAGQEFRSWASRAVVAVSVAVRESVYPWSIHGNMLGKTGSCSKLSLLSVLAWITTLCWTR